MQQNMNENYALFIRFPKISLDLSIITLGGTEPTLIIIYKKYDVIFFLFIPSSYCFVNREQ